MKQKQKSKFAENTRRLAYYLIVINLLFVTTVANAQIPGIDHQTLYENDDIREYADSMIQWLRERGGFMSEKVEIRRRVPGDPTTPSGLFVTQDVEVDEVLFRIPSDLYLKVADHDVTDAYYVGLCRLATRLIEETKLYQSSPSSTIFAPYIRYLEETQPKGQLPATYSPEGKAVLRMIQGVVTEEEKFRSPHYGRSPIPPKDLVDWIDEKFVKRGCIEADDADTYHAVALVVQRGFDLELIPVWDMVNHNVREKVNIETNHVRSEEGLVVWATQPIPAGNEIFYSYNYCADCENIGTEWGTPGIFRDFGFLEDYPQEWPFLDQKVFAQIQHDKTGNTTHGFSAKLFTQDVDLVDFESTGDDLRPILSPLDVEHMSFFENHLSRLKRIDLQSELENVLSPYERFMIREYFESLVIALSSIIDTENEHFQNQTVCTPNGPEVMKSFC